MMRFEWPMDESSLRLLRTRLRMSQHDLRDPGPRTMYDMQASWKVEEDVLGIFPLSDRSDGFGLLSSFVSKHRQLISISLYGLSFSDTAHMQPRALAPSERSI